MSKWFFLNLPYNCIKYKKIKITIHNFVELHFVLRHSYSVRSGRHNSISHRLLTHLPYYLYEETSKLRPKVTFLTQQGQHNIADPLENLELNFDNNRIIHHTSPKLRIFKLGKVSYRFISSYLDRVQVMKPIS